MRPVFLLPLVLFAGCRSAARLSNACPPLPDPNTGISYVQIEEEGIETMDGALRRIPGVQINGSHVTVRGQTTVRGSAEPLVVIDGTTATQRGLAGLSALSVRDVYTLEALKNPSDLVFYGIQGGSGVLRAVTKRGGCP